MYATDENYVKVAGVSIESLLDNNRGVDELNLFIVIDDDVTSKSKRMLRDTANKYDRKAILLAKPNIRELTGTELHTLRWSDSAFSRLYVDKVFEDYPEVEKILYLDCDTLIVDSLVDLWNLDISDYLGAGVLECMGDWHKRILGAKKKDHFFNSGVMLLNIKKWREDCISQKCSEYIRDRKGKIEYVDQGVINGILSRNIKVVDSPRYNLTALSWDFSYEEMQIYRKPDHGYSKEVWEEAKDNPAIIHFTTSFLSIRPWFEESKTPYSMKWLDYKEISAWCDIPLKKANESIIHHVILEVFKILPRKVAISFAGFLHAYVKPVVFVLI